MPRREAYLIACCWIFLLYFGRLFLVVRRHSLRETFPNTTRVKSSEISRAVYARVQLRTVSTDSAEYGEFRLGENIEAPLVIRVGHVLSRCSKSV